MKDDGKLILTILINKIYQKNLERKNIGENFSLDTMDDTIELRLIDGGPPGPLPPVRVWKLWNNCKITKNFYLCNFHNPGFRLTDVLRFPFW